MDRQSTPVGSQLRKLLVATLALTACRVLSQWNSLVAGFAALLVLLVLATSIIAGMPRVRRVLLIPALSASTLANGAALGLGAFIVLLGTRGFLPAERITSQGPPWNLAFALVPLAATTNLVWLARPTSTSRWLGCVWVMNLASAGYSIWSWQAAYGFSQILPLPVAPGLLVGLTILSMATLAWENRAQASSGSAGPRCVRRAFVSASALLMFAAIWLTLFPVYRKREVAHTLETFGFHPNFGVVFPGWKLPIEIPYEWYAYLGEVSSAWTPEVRDGDALRAGEVLNSLPWLDFMTVHELRPGAERILQPLAGHTGLRQIALMGAGVTDQTLADAARIPALNRAVFERTKITDAALANLAGMRWLQALAIRQTPISGDGLAHLQSLPALTELDLSGTNVGDRQLTDLAKFKSLAELSLADTPLTDDGLASLARCKTLKRITFNSTRVTESGVDQLRRALPKCQVLWQRTAEQ